MSLHSDHSQQLWVWKVEDQSMYYDVHEMVRFQVIDEEWNDQTPTAPVTPGEEPVAAGEEKERPYKIKGNMNGTGLGVCLWWDD